MKNINIVYFAWINEKKNWRNIIEGQFLDIVKSNILNYAKIFIEVTCENPNLVDDVKNLFVNILIQNNEHDYEIQMHDINHFEYYGIKKLYDLAKLEPDKYYLYLHSKGIFNYGNIEERHNNELTLTKGTVYLFKTV
jgi:adenylate cyclase